MIVTVILCCDVLLSAPAAQGQILGDLDVEAAMLPSCGRENLYSPGQLVRVQGFGFKEEGMVTIELRALFGLYRRVLDPIPVDAGGRLDSFIRLPGIVPPFGTVLISAADLSGGRNSRVLYAEVVLASRLYWPFRFPLALTSLG